MANSKGSSSNIRNFIYSSKHPLLPPKSPFPTNTPSYPEHFQNSVIGSKPAHNAYHQRTSSESVIIEEQPSWLDDLLNEPETPVRRGAHRRSSSDSFAYNLDLANVSNNFDYYNTSAQDDLRFKNPVSIPWGSHEFDYHKNVRRAPFYPEVNLPKQRSRAWELPSNVSSRENNVPQKSGSSPGGAQESETIPSTVNEKQDGIESGCYDSKGQPETKDSSSAKPSTSDVDTKRAKQQFAQRSRVRKLQYIAELERNVQALQVDGSGVSAELEFLNQQNLILSMENKALKQRLENLSQEQLIKYMEQDVLEREIGRLRGIYQQQQHPVQQPSSSHRRSTSRDLDSQLANLSLK
ncbi:hypothetical protein ACFE04_003679 [Oxalis oulophora]